MRTHVKLRDLSTSVPVVDDRRTISRHHLQISCHVVRCSWSQRFYSARCNSGEGAGGQREQIPRAAGVSWLWWGSKRVVDGVSKR